MGFLYNFLQLLGWIGAGYNLHAHNNWAVFGCVMFSMSMGLLSAMDMVGKQMRANGSSSK